MNSVKLDIHFQSSAADLWNAWTDPYLVKKWFGSDPAGTVLHAMTNVKPSGIFSVTFADSDGTQHTCTGTYSDIKLHVQLSFTWEWKSEPGHVSRVNVSFTPDKEGTLMKFEHSNLHPDSLHGYQGGWKRTFEKLKSALNEHTI